MTTNSLKSGDLFPPELVREIFSKVKGESVLAELSNQEPIPFTGTEQFIFNLEGNAQIVGEGEAKEPGKATLTSKVIKPMKFVYQARFTDEFKYASEEKQLNYLKVFSDGFSKKIAQAFDIAALHGLEPRTMTDASFKATNSFDGLVTDNVIEYDPDTIDKDLNSAIQTVVFNGEKVSGIALSPQAAFAMGNLEVNGMPKHEAFTFGRRPETFHGMDISINNTLTTVKEGAEKVHAIVGDFVNSFKWGYAENIRLEMLEHGDPDGAGDLNRYNEILLRAEAFIGWGILLPENFARIVETETEAEELEE